jgi:hypothetical protein
MNARQAGGETTAAKYRNQLRGCRALGQLVSIQVSSGSWQNQQVLRFDLVREAGNHETVRSRNEPAGTGRAQRQSTGRAERRQPRPDPRGGRVRSHPDERSRRADEAAVRSSPP